MKIWIIYWKIGKNTEHRGFLMKVYAVGGQVRDEIMGVEPKDRDYVVVGSSIEEMLSLGFTKVGAHFPVFLHPTTGEEYALARTEVSTGDGYNDYFVQFAPTVTIEEDLRRRDLTINSIAKDLETGEYIDPFGGIKDIKRKVIRATDPLAFVEDPLRILRAFRFSARFGWPLSRDTAKLICESKDKLEALPKERKFKELEKVLSTKNEDISEFFVGMAVVGEYPELMRLTGVLQPEEHHPEGDAFKHTLLCLDYANTCTQTDIPYTAKELFAVLCHDFGKAIYWETGKLHGHEVAGVEIVKKFCDRIGAPKDWRDLAVLVCKHHSHVHGVMNMKPLKVYDLLKSFGFEHQTATTFSVIRCCVADARGRGPSKVDCSYPQGIYLSLIMKDYLENRTAIKEESHRLAAKWVGNVEMCKAEIRAAKIGVIRKAIKKLTV